METANGPTAAPSSRRRWWGALIVFSLLIPVAVVLWWRQAIKPAYKTAHAALYQEFSPELQMGPERRAYVLQQLTIAEKRLVSLGQEIDTLMQNRQLVCDEKLQPEFSRRLASSTSTFEQARRLCADAGQWNAPRPLEVYAALDELRRTRATIESLNRLTEEEAKWLNTTVGWTASSKRLAEIENPKLSALIAEANAITQVGQQTRSEREVADAEARNEAMRLQKEYAAQAAAMQQRQAQLRQAAVERAAELNREREEAKQVADSEVLAALCGDRKLPGYVPAGYAPYLAENYEMFKRYVVDASRYYGSVMPTRYPEPTPDVHRAFKLVARHLSGRLLWSTDRERMKLKLAGNPFGSLPAPADPSYQPLLGDLRRITGEERSQADALVNSGELSWIAGLPHQRWHAGARDAAFLASDYRLFEEYVRRAKRYSVQYGYGGSVPDPTPELFYNFQLLAAYRPDAFLWEDSREPLTLAYQVRPSYKMVNWDTRLFRNGLPYQERGENAVVLNFTHLLRDRR